MLKHLLNLVVTACLAAWIGIAISACSKDPTAAQMSELPIAEIDRLAARGNLDAVTELSARYAGGKDVAKDEQKALELLKRAIDKRHPYATFLMGVAYANGIGVPQNEAEAVIWYQRAAELGDMNGQYWLAFMVGNGRGGIGATWSGAVPLLVKAAEQGHSDARFMLGYLFQTGSGVDQNFEQAATWYRLASQPRFNQKAQFNLANMIAEGHVAWQDGDPGQKPVTVTKPLEAAGAGPSSPDRTSHE